MCLAEHFAIRHIGGTALAPGCDMIRVHIGKFPDLALVGIVSESTVRTIGYAFLFCFHSLFSVHCFFGCFVKDADFEEFGVYRATEDIFKNPFASLDIAVPIELSHFS